MCYHVLIYAEFEIINIFFKERRSKYKLAYALNTHNVLHFSCFPRDFSLVMDIWFKVMEIHWAKCVRTLCVSTEELFSLGPAELGCLEDKDKAGAKVSFKVLVAVTKDVMSLCVKRNAVLLSFPRSE